MDTTIEEAQRFLNELPPRGTILTRAELNEGRYHLGGKLSSGRSAWRIIPITRPLEAYHGQAQRLEIEGMDVRVWGDDGLFQQEALVVQPGDDLAKVIEGLHRSANALCHHPRRRAPTDEETHRFKLYGGNCLHHSMCADCGAPITIDSSD